MNTIVRNHYPAERLPEELRPNDAAGKFVQVVVTTEEPPPERIRSLAEIFSDNSGPFLSKQAIDDHIRRLREGWDD